MVIGIIEKIYDKDDPVYDIHDSTPENEKLAVYRPSKLFIVENAHWKLYT